ncbi:MAG: ATP-dependent zinc metalloprotease FtsH [Eubacterium sp.]|nr:ATP-dependent zinc metalloprotease FtsH [Eubacterium sp.]
MEENNNNNNNNNNNDNKRPGGFNNTIAIVIITLVLSIIFIMALNNYRSSGEKEVSYDKFIKMVDEGTVKDVKIYEKKIKFTPDEKDTKTQNVTYYVIRTDDYDLINRLEKSNVKFTAIDEGGNAILGQVLYYVLFFAVMYFITMMIFRRVSSGAGGFMNVGKSNAKLYDMTKNTGITFKDVAGEEEAKESLTEMVDFLRQPGRYLEIGAKLPRGALLVGPPGTGKTLLAKAVAGEAGVPFFSMSGSEFVEMYVGVGASRVRDLFHQATLKAPCIIFIDEIDAIGRSRDTRHMGGDSEREQTLNQLLSEMDGFDTSKGIIILAATNRPEVLDKALLRPGRFDRRVIVEEPDLKGREDILRVHAKEVKIDETVDFHEIALATSGSVGADLANIINEAALTAVRKGRKFVSQDDLLESIEVVFAGKEKKDKVLSERDKRITAYHEIGHALLTVLQKHTNPIQKITIVPRMMGSLGYVWHTPDEEKNHMTQAEMEAQIVITMGGRVAESLKFPSVTSGAVQDIEDATKYARTMVTMYGMSEKLGMVQYEAITGEYLDKRRVLLCSDETATKIDDEVRSIIGRAYKKAYDLLSQHLDLMDKLADYLVEHETISGEQFMTIYNEITGSDLPITRQLDSKGYAIDSEELYDIGIVNPGTSEDYSASDYFKAPKLKKQKKVKVTDKEKALKKAKKEKEKLAKKEKAAKKMEDKRRVFTSPAFNKKREELLNDSEEDDEETPEILSGEMVSHVVGGATLAPETSDDIKTPETSEAPTVEEPKSGENPAGDNGSDDTPNGGNEPKEGQMPWEQE